MVNLIDDEQRPIAEKLEVEQKIRENSSQLFNKVRTNHDMRKRQYF